ncbi:MAG: hypothetical protein K2L27_06295 [Muribaculaceae bacterium]|nr:hypothetical protein [Muribaculaceae bacterium]
MTIFKSIRCAAAIAGIAVATAACTDEVPQLSTDELYLRGFIKEFGVPAKDHTWSMAEPVRAEVALAPSVSGTARFYTDSPNAPGSSILAAVPVSGGRASMRFDIETGTKSLYARVERPDGTVVFGGYVYPENGTVRIADNGSRAGGDCPVTAKPLEYKTVRVTDRNLDVIKPYVGDGTTTWEDLYYNIIGHDGMDPIDNKVEVSVPRLYSLNNFDYSQRTPEFSNLDIVPVVHTYINDEGEEKRGVFGNQSDASEYGNDDNVTHYFFKQQILDPDVTMTVREEGDVTMDLMWRTMEGDTYWGYYYYSPEDEAELYADPKKFFEEVPKYVVFRRNEVEPEHSLSGNNALMQFRYCNQWSSHPDKYNPNMNHEGDHVFGEWENLESTRAKTINTQIKQFRPAQFRSVRIRLVYFGKHGDSEQGSYTFPAGTRIGFFYGSVSGSNKFYFGNAAMNYYLFHYHMYVMGGNDFTPVEKPDNYSIFAAKYRFDGSNYVGFEEGGGDNDINDIVFRIHNTWPPETDLTPDDFPVAEPKEWIVACEDLGSTDDYDFNDIVLAVNHISGENMITIRPLACGGVLESFVYFGGTEPEHALGEIHDLLGVKRGVMAGVGNGTPDIDFSKVKLIGRSVPEGWLMSESLHDFHIWTLPEDATQMNQGVWIDHEANSEGEFRAPQMLLLPEGWRWPMERLNITRGYPDFKGWIGKPTDHHGWTGVGEHNDHLLYRRID